MNTQLLSVVTYKKKITMLICSSFVKINYSQVLLKDGDNSEKCVLRQFHHRVNITDYTETGLDGKPTTHLG